MATVIQHFNIKKCFFFQGGDRGGDDLWCSSPVDHSWGSVHLLHTEKVQPQRGGQVHQRRLHTV